MKSIRKNFEKPVILSCIHLKKRGNPFIGHQETVPSLPTLSSALRQVSSARRQRKNETNMGAEERNCKKEIGRPVHNPTCDPLATPNYFVRPVLHVAATPSVT